MINIIIYFSLIVILVCNYYNNKSLYTKYNYKMKKYCQDCQEEQYVKARKLQLKEEISKRDEFKLYIDELEEIECYGDDFLNEILNCEKRLSN